MIECFNIPFLLGEYVKPSHRKDHRAAECTDPHQPWRVVPVSRRANAAPEITGVKYSTPDERAPLGKQRAGNKVPAGGHVTVNFSVPKAVS